MADQRPCFFPDIGKFLCRELSHVFFLQQRIFTVQICVRKNLLDQLNDSRRKQVQIEVRHQQQKHDLCQHSRDFRDRQNIGLDIILLLRVGQAVLVSHKVGTHRIEQKNQIITDQIGVAVDSHRILDDEFQKRNQRKPHAGDHKGDHPVCLLIKLHIGLDRFLIPSGHRPIQAEIHRRSQSQFCQGKYGKNAAVGAVDTEQRFAQLYDKYLL